MSENFPSGLGELLGSDLAINEPFMTAGTVWFVRSTTGTDAASPAGRDKQKPLATLAQAQTNATAGDTIVCLSGHTETFTTALVISKQLYIVGTGTVSGKPGASFLINDNNSDVFKLSAAGTSLHNLYFPASVQSNTGDEGGKVAVNATDILINGCYFECGALDQTAGIIDQIAATRLRVQDCTFISTATTTATQPTYGLKIKVAAADIEVMGCVFSDGTAGFSGAAFDSSTVTLTRFRGQNNSLLLGADMLFAAATTYRISGITSTSGGRVQIV